ncbi:MAG: hypothetical protein JNL08_18355 [Planctomycetes bacterium]|nr:hypothetical protein [Planctomycetota bacterium]
MKQKILLGLAAAAVVGAPALAQSNERGPGYNAALTQANSATDWGRRGTYPNGEVAVSFANQLCNPGTINVNWFSPGGSPGATIQSDHPKFGFLVAREQDGRLVQISDWSYCKHAFFALSSPSVCGGTCQSTNGSQLGVSCSDVYSNGNNGSRNYLGPPAEINPWLGTWNSTGNYFDIGQPNQAGYPLPADGIYSLSTTGYDAVEKRVTLQENLIPQGVDMFFQILVIVEGERVENRANNIGTNTFRMTIANPTATGTSAWTTTTGTSFQQGTSILNRWTGASIGTGSNGGTGTMADFDGRFQVAVKVTGPTNGLWHYEYAVLNVDNHGGGSAFSIPVCPTAKVLNLGFRDIDQNALNNWTATVSGGEITWNAAVGNAHRWNQLFNFWFDSDAAPVAGLATIDQATLLPGAQLSLTVPTSVPGLQPAVDLGAGCGTPSLQLAGNGLANIGNAGFGLLATSAPNTPFLTMFSSPSPSFSLPPGCNVYLNILSYSDLGLAFTDAGGNAFLPIPVSPLWTPFDMTFQALTFVPAPPLFGLFGLSNGLTVRFGGVGCQ